MTLKDKDTVKFEAIQKHRVVKAKEAKKKSEALNEAIRDKQKAKRVVERELVQNSLNYFRETVQKDMEKEAKEVKEVSMRSRSAAKKNENAVQISSTEVFDAIFENVKEFYKHYDSQSVEIKHRIDSKLTDQVKKLEKFARRAKSVPRADRVDELANAYIQKVKKYDSTKALKEHKHMKSMIAKDKLFKETMKSKKRIILDQNKEKQADRKENLAKNEEKALKVIQNKAQVLAKVTSEARKNNEQVNIHQDRVQEVHEGQVV